VVGDYDYESAKSKLAVTSIDLLVTVGLIGSVMNRYPEEVQENFVEKIEAISDRLVQEMMEFTAFGEALDDHVEDD